MRIKRTFSWRDGDVEYRQEFAVADGRTILVGEPFVSGERTREAPKQCVECEAQITRGIGGDYYGTPFYKRIRLRWPVYLKRLPGCGCLKAIKDWWDKRCQ